MWSPSASSGAWANLMTNTLCERLDSRLSWVLAILLFFCPRKIESEILSIWYSDKKKSLKNHHWTKSHLSVTKKDQNQRMNERKKERKKTDRSERNHFQLTFPKDFKSLFCGLHLHFGAASHIHVVVLILAENFGLRWSGKKEWI